MRRATIFSNWKLSDFCYDRVETVNVIVEINFNGFGGFFKDSNVCFEML